LEEKSIYKELNYFLKAKKNIFKGNDLADKAAREIFALL